jgi:hypothetical protein
MNAEQFEIFFAAMNAASDATKIAAEFLVGERNIGNESIVGLDNDGVRELYVSHAGTLRSNAQALVAFADMIEARADEVQL